MSAAVGSTRRSVEQRVSHRRPESSGPVACVMGDTDLLRPLGLAGIPCVVMAEPGEPARFSRFSKATLEWVDGWAQPEALVDTLMRFAATQPERPVLFYEEDRELLVVSRFRERLSQGFRFVVPDPTLVEDLVDKARFQALAARLELPVARARHLSPSLGATPPELDLRFPIIIKPLTRRNEVWEPVGGQGKALRLDSPDELRRVWSAIIASRMDVIAQELIPGAESRIESYHVYVDEHRETVGEFTGQKIRTYPEQYGHSTALMITRSPDVTALGRELVRRLDLRGVAKFDFKRGPDGQLYLMEINPRFTLWNHPGALAGVNLPALVYTDLVGNPRATPSPAQPGVTWCKFWHDRSAAKAAGVPFLEWLRWALRCQAKRHLAWDDPVPLLYGVLWRLLPRWGR